MESKPALSDHCLVFSSVLQEQPLKTGPRAGGGCSGARRGLTSSKPPVTGQPRVLCANDAEQAAQLSPSFVHETAGERPLNGTWITGHDRPAAPEPRGLVSAPKRGFRHITHCAFRVM